MRATFAAFLLISANALADPQPWMKKENPNELAIELIVSDECGFSQLDALEVMTGVLIRSRIKPLDLIAVSDSLGLQANVTCLRLGSFLVTVDFIELSHTGAKRLGRNSYTIFGNSNNEQRRVLDSLETIVEDAITDYSQVVIFGSWLRR